MVERGTSVPSLWCECERELIYRLVGTARGLWSGRAPQCPGQKSMFSCVQKCSWEKVVSLYSPPPRGGPSPPFYTIREGTESVGRGRGSLVAPVTVGPSGPDIAVLLLREWIRPVAQSAGRRTWAVLAVVRHAPTLCLLRHRPRRGRALLFAASGHVLSSVVPRRLSVSVRRGPWWARLLVGCTSFT